MKRTEIARIFADQEAFGGQTVTVCGWARTIRDMKAFGFVELNDGSCFKNLQIVMEDSGDITAAVEKLIDRANYYGGKDNISVVVAVK